MKKNMVFEVIELEICLLKEFLEKRMYSLFLFFIYLRHATLHIHDY